MLTMISTAAMVRSGKVYENLMVDVAPTSQKLVERAKGLVMHLGGVDYEEAGALLERCDYEVKPAVVMAARPPTGMPTNALSRGTKIENGVPGAWTAIGSS